MGISPWPQGQTDPPMPLQFVNDSGNPPNGLAGAIFSVSIRNTKTLQDQAGAGSFQLIAPTQGLINYTADPADSAIPGEYELRFQYVIGTRKGIGDPIPWTVAPV